MMFNSDQGYRVLGFNSRLENARRHALVRATAGPLPCRFAAAETGTLYRRLEIRSNEKPTITSSMPPRRISNLAISYGTNEMLWHYEGSIVHRAEWEI